MKSGQISKEISEPILPTPQNGVIYTPVEAYRVLKKLEGKQRFAVIRTMIEEGLVLCRTTQIYRMLKRDESDLKSWWNECGRPAILDQTTLDEAIKKLDMNVGMSLGRDAVPELLQAAKAKKWTRQV